MKQYIYRKLNAFSVGESKGNPAACIFLNIDQQLSESEMLDIAKEHKGFVSEAIYCTPLENHSYRLRYYSSECEVEFCGHGTIACMYNLIKTNEELKNIPEVIIQTNKGELTVYNEIQSLDAVFITSPKPEYITTSISYNEIVNNLKIGETAFNKEHPVRLIDAGLRTLIVPIRNLTDIINIHPNELELKEFCLINNIDIILVFTTEVANKNNHLRTRVFAPKFGYLEDPATGSGNSALGYYMMKQNLWDGTPISIEQNSEIDNYNIVKLKTINNRVLFGGNAVVKIEGQYFL